MSELKACSDDEGSAHRSETHRVDTGWGRVYVIIGSVGDSTVRLQVVAGQSGGFINSWCEALSELATLALRSGAPASGVSDALLGIRTDRIDVDNGDAVLSIPDAAGIALKRHVEGRPGESVVGDFAERDEGHVADE